MQADENRSVEEILASRAVSKTRLTADEGKIICGNHQALRDELANQEMQKFAVEVINPWAKAVERAREIENRHAPDEATEQTENRTGYVVRDMPTFPRPELTLPAPEEGVYLPAGCTQMFFLEPPYDYGEPADTVWTHTEPPYGLPNDPLYVSCAALALPESGDLSLGVAGGMYWDEQYYTYPTPETTFLLNSRSVSARLCETIDFLSPLQTPAEVTVTIDVRVGPPSLPPEIVRLNAREPYGVVGVIGDCFLTLEPDGRDLGSRTDRERFLYVARNSRRYFTGVDRRYFRVSETIYLCPGASSLGVVVEAKLHALVWPNPEVENPGWAVVDLQTREETTHRVPRILPEQYFVHGGPLTVTRMGFMVCPKPEEICVAQELPNNRA